jgi:two-component sensor histidine kinase
MKDNRNLFLITLLNLVLSLVTVFISPRPDLITLCCFILANSILFFLLILNEKHKKNEIKAKIDDIFSLLHSLGTDIKNYEVIDDEFGGLRDEIVKVIGEKKT